jgi:hypothetical protein
LQDLPSLARKDSKVITIAEINLFNGLKTHECTFYSHMISAVTFHTLHQRLKHSIPRMVEFPRAGLPANNPTRSFWQSQPDSTASAANSYVYEEIDADAVREC